MGIPGDRISPADFINGEREVEIAPIIMGTRESKMAKHTAFF